MPASPLQTITGRRSEILRCIVTQPLYVDCMNNFNNTCFIIHKLNTKTGNGSTDTDDFGLFYEINLSIIDQNIFDGFEWFDMIQIHTLVRGEHTDNMSTKMYIFTFFLLFKFCFFLVLPPTTNF